MTPAARGDAVRAMLEAKSIAIVGASGRPDSFGARMVAEVRRARGGRRIDLVNPRWDEIDGQPCARSLLELDEAPDLVLLGVGDHVVVDQLADAAARGARSAVAFGSLHARGVRAAVTRVARGSGMALCGGGCMGFLNVPDGLRATGYVEREIVTPGPISLVTHSGSVFSALLRTRRALGYGLVVSSGQELVTNTADYLEHILTRTDSSLVGLVLETVRDGPRLRSALRQAAEQDVDVVLLAVGGSPRGAAMVAAHSGAVAGDDATWEALCADAGVRRVGDLAELTDTLELLSAARRHRGRRGGALATVHDSGAERTLLVDLAERLDVPFAAIGEPTRARLAALLDDGLIATNPLDVWGSGSNTRQLFGGCLQAMADDPAVGAVVLAVDLVAEYDGDTSYPDAVLDVATACDVPVAVLSNLAAAVDEPTAARLRTAGVPVLEGTRSGLVALRHLLQPPRAVTGQSFTVDGTRRDRWHERLGPASDLTATETWELLADYGIPVVPARAADTIEAVLDAGRAIGFPIVLKTAAPGVAHKSDVGGVSLGLADEAALTAAYQGMSHLGAQVTVCAQVRAGVELSVGFVSDYALGPLVVVAAGGVLVELLADRAVALPPVSPEHASRLLGGLRVDRLLAGYRGAPALARHAVADLVHRVSVLALELGDVVDALEVNPVIVSTTGALAVDALLVLPPAD